MNFLTELNTAQQQAVEAPVGTPVLVHAVPGSGKTKTLICRMASLMEQGIHPQNILAVTFTNKAAREMRERLEVMVGSSVAQTQISTFHRAMLRIIRANPSYKPLQHRRNGITDGDIFVKMVEIDIRALNADYATMSPLSVLGEISRAKRNMISPDGYLGWIELPQVMPSGLRCSDSDFAQIYTKYELALQDYGMIDLDDIQLYAARIFEDVPRELERWSNIWQHILVDEYQDTDPVENKIICELADKHRSLFVVGDPDQSIYAFRGADIRNIMHLKSQFPELITINMNTNYRSTKSIVTASMELISHNRHRLHQTAVTDNAVGEEPTIIMGIDDDDMAQQIIAKLRIWSLTAFDLESVRIPTDSPVWNEYAILTPTHLIKKVVAQAMMRGGYSNSCHPKSRVVAETNHQTCCGLAPVGRYSRESFVRSRSFTNYQRRG